MLAARGRELFVRQSFEMAGDDHLSILGRQCGEALVHAVSILGVPERLERRIAGIGQLERAGFGGVDPSSAPAGLVPEPHQGLVCDDSMEPGREARTARELIAMSKRLFVGILNHVARRLTVPREAERDRPHPGFEPLQNFADGIDSVRRIAEPGKAMRRIAEPRKATRCLAEP